MPHGYIGGEGEHDREYTRFRLALLRLALIMPPYARARLRGRVLDTVEGELRERGFRVPPWMGRLRDELT